MHVCFCFMLTYMPCVFYLVVHMFCIALFDIIIYYVKLCHHVFHSLATTAGFKWLPYDGSEPYTYNRAILFCEKNALQLCSREQYCEGGKGGTLLAGAGDMAVGDKWAPVRDGDNTWVHTGDGGGHGHKRCWTHFEQDYGKARWGITGLTSDEGGEGRDVCCSSILLSGVYCFC